MIFGPVFTRKTSNKSCGYYLIPGKFIPLKFKFSGLYQRDIND
uniref:Uncharacterized protein n=1 Tax=mine drainage metagenome TaxID=410659 RepID=E6QRJ4_9ZZZZ